MLTLERSSGCKSPPPNEPVDPGDIRFWEGQFRPPEIEPFPKAHLVGRTILEDRVASAEARWEAGQSLSRTEIDLLQLAQETVLDDYDYLPE